MLGQIEVSKLDVPRRLDKDVLCFDVFTDGLILMNMANGHGYLCNDELGLLL